MKSWPWIVVLFVLYLGFGYLLAQTSTPVPAPSTTPEPPVTVAQAEATQPGVPPTNVPPSETLGWSFTLGIIANWLMRCGKKSTWFPFLQNGAGKINVAVAAGLAFAASIGIHTEFDPTVRSFTIMGIPTLLGLVHIGGDFVKQWALQQFTYQTMKVDTRG